MEPKSPFVDQQLIARVPWSTPSVSRGDEVGLEKIEQDLLRHKMIELQERFSEGNVNLFDRIRTANLLSATQREARKIILNNRIAVLRHQAEAAERESKAFWEAKSAESVERVKAQIQNSLNMLRHESNDRKAKLLKAVYEAWFAKLAEIEKNTSLPSEVKEAYTSDVNELFSQTVAEIKDDSLARRYGLV